MYDGEEWDIYNGIDDKLRDEIMLYMTNRDNLREMIPELGKAAESQQRILGSDMVIDVHVQVPIIAGDSDYKRIRGWWDVVVQAGGAIYCVLIVPHIASAERVLRTIKAYRELDSERTSARVCVVSMDSDRRYVLEREGIPLYVYSRDRNR